MTRPPAVVAAHDAVGEVIRSPRWRDYWLRAQVAVDAARPHIEADLRVELAARIRALQTLHPDLPAEAFDLCHDLVTAGDTHD